MRRGSAYAIWGLALSIALWGNAPKAGAAEVDREVIARILASRTQCAVKVHSGETYEFRCPWRQEPYLWRCEDWYHGKCEVPRRPKAKQR